MQAIADELREGQLDRLPDRADAEQPYVVDATELMAKCPSKYEGAQPSRKSTPSSSEQPMNDNAFRSRRSRWSARSPCSPPTLVAAWCVAAGIAGNARKSRRLVTSSVYGLYGFARADRRSRRR